MYKKILIIKKEFPKPEIDEEIKWISDTFGMFDSDRDKEKSCYRVFVELVKEQLERQKSLRSDDIAIRSRLSRGTVVFHLNKLMESGLIKNEENKYKLKEKKLSSIIRKIRKEFNEHLKKAELVAKDFENKF